MLDRYKIGVEVVGINLQQGGVRPPEQVQAAFDDVLRAGQERERAKNEAQAYANDVIPRATGAASRLAQEAEGYKARIVAQAEGDGQRFKLLLAEYQKAPQVTRDRLYLDSMQQIYSNVTKVLVDSRQGSNMLFLPLDKIMQQVAQGGAAAPRPRPSRRRPPHPPSHFARRRATRAAATTAAAASASRSLQEARHEPNRHSSFPRCWWRWRCSAPCCSSSTSASSAWSTRSARSRK
jgi:membrane protease subunit HflK